MLTHDKYQRYGDLWLERDPNELMVTESGWITAHTHLGEEGGNTQLEDWQAFLVDSPEPYNWWAKSRQVGFSWAAALKKLARSHLIPRLEGRPYLGIFLSLNQDESKEKIHYLRAAHDTLPRYLREGKLKLTADSKEAVEFANGSRVFSFPAKAPRGKSKADLTLDEFAHIPNVEQVYRGSTAAGIRAKVGSAQVSIGSTPLGDIGLFHEIGHSEKGYKTYHGNRYWVHWWDSQALCRDVRGARQAASDENWILHPDRSSVEERVQRYAGEKLKLEFDSVDLETFLQEYEAVFGANKNAFIPGELVREAVDPEFDGVMYQAVSLKSETQFRSELNLELARAYQHVPKGEAVWAGYDVARKHDWAALALFCPIRRVVSPTETALKAVLIGRFLFRDIPYPWQERLLSDLLRDRRTYRVRIDSTGAGGPIAESLIEGWGETRVEAVPFTNPAKLSMGGRMKFLYEKGVILHTGDREVVRQVGSVQKNITPSGLISLEGTGQDHHADLFWAMALALETMPVDFAPREIVMEAKRNLGDDKEMEDEEEMRSEYRNKLRDTTRQVDPRDRFTVDDDEED